tara:strand:+ start:139 stop:258 length:120 start_codon:yes stop_codon:yes gene_type:complete
LDIVNYEQIVPKGGQVRNEQEEQKIRKKMPHFFQQNINP